MKTVIKIIIITIYNDEEENKINIFQSYYNFLVKAGVSKKKLKIAIFKTKI